LRGTLRQDPHSRGIATPGGWVLYSAPLKGDGFGKWSLAVGATEDKFSLTSAISSGGTALSRPGHRGFSMFAARQGTLGFTLRSVAGRYNLPWSTLRGGNRSPFRVVIVPRRKLVEPSQLDLSEGGFSRPVKLSQLEAILFLAREPLGSRKLALLSGLADGTEARTLVRTLNRLYDEEGCAFRVVEVAGGFQLMTRAKFAPWVRRLQAASNVVRLSVPALETLAVVAYRQPVLRADVEAIRGVQCGEILRQLMERGLIRIVGRSEELGRPLLYGTTRQFLQVFGLRDLDQLPRLDGLQAAAKQPKTELESGKHIVQGTEREQSNQLGFSHDPGGDLTVKTNNPTDTLWETDPLAPALATLDARDSRLVAGPEDYEDEDEDLDEDEDEDYDEDEDLDDEDFEDSDWEEVEDDEEFDEDEDEDLDEDEDEDWDDEDEDWDDEDEDWDDEDEDWEDEDDVDDDE